MKKDNQVSLKFIRSTFILIFVFSLISVQFNSGIVPIFERPDSQQTSKSLGSSNGELDDLDNSIHILGNDQFRQMATQMNWVGDGTAENPFLIKDLTLKGIEWQTVIEIRGTTVHFVISNCIITGGETGINLAYITNGRIENNTIRYSMDFGLSLEEVEDSQIFKNNFHYCATGISLHRSSNIKLKQNILSNNSDYSIQLQNSNDNTIGENLVYHNRNGIELSDSMNNTISQNIIYENKMSEYDDWWYGGIGINLYYSHRNMIFDNQILNNEQDGLYLYDSSNNQIIQNIISGNGADGLRLSDSVANVIQENQIENNIRGINLRYSPDNSILNNTLVNNGLVISGDEIDTYKQAEVMNNTVNEKPLIWWQSVSGKTVPEAGEIILLDCSNLLITGQNVTSASVGISTYFSRNISIHNNSLSNNTNSGIRFSDVENCTISSNNITNNGYGIYGKHFAGVKIVENIIKNNLGRGIEVFHNDLDTSVFDGHEYQLIKTSRTWNDAKTDCEAQGGHLVTITSQEENNFVQNLARGDSIWIGLTDETIEGEWQWVTGEPLTYTNWNGGEPNDYGGEDYTEMQEDGLWNDVPGSYFVHFYVCEWETIQTVKRSTNISRNVIINNSDGIKLGNVQNIPLNDNEIINNAFSGLEVEYSSACNITRNNVINNGGGIKLWASGYNRITNNTLLGNGLIIDGWDSAHFNQVEVVNNSVNRKPLIYWIDISNKTVIEAGQIFLINCYNITISNQNLSHASGGIVGFNCNKIALINNTVNYNNEFGVVFSRSNDCDIINNTFSFNRYAIQIKDLDKFTIINNTITTNQDGGIIIEGCDPYYTYPSECVNTIEDNRVINSSRGIELRDNMYNLWISIIHNTIINNSECGISIHDLELGITIYGDISRGVGLGSRNIKVNVTDNLVEHNGGGIEIESVEGCVLMNNTIIGHGFHIHRMESHQFNEWIVKNNTVNDKPIIFWMDITDSVVPETAGQVFLIRVQRINVTNLNIDSVANSIYAIASDDVKIQNCQFSNNNKSALRFEVTINFNISGNYIIQSDQGIYLQESEFSIIENNVITNNQNGINLWNSPDTQIKGNIIHNNSWQGVSVQESPNIVILNNSIMNHDYQGVFVSGSTFCDIMNNIMADNNGYGIELSWGTKICLVEDNLIQNNSDGIAVFSELSATTTHK
ncbi:MAG: right-handed parallel beta-helix repeat-containing protein, partial [Candidatus Hodarchaeota archaeon]